MMSIPRRWPPPPLPLGDTRGGVKSAGRKCAKPERASGRVSRTANKHTARPGALTSRANYELRSQTITRAPDEQSHRLSRYNQAKQCRSGDRLAQLQLIVRPECACAPLRSGRRLAIAHSNMRPASYLRRRVCASNLI